MTVPHTVICGEFSHYQDPDEEWTVTGFATQDAATEYARRLVRSSVEAHRMAGATADAVFNTWMSFGEYAGTAGFSSLEWARYCAANPATTAEDTNFKALDPR